MRYPFTFALLTLFLSAAPTLASAQLLTASGFGTNLSIALSPQSPRPGQQVLLTAQGVGIDLQGSSIVWHAGGNIIAQGVGANTATLTAGALGSVVPIEVDVATQGGGTYSAQATIAPTTLDLLVSSDSYVPPFFRGRAFPSAGTDLLVQAVPTFVRADGSTIPVSSITFTWKKDGQVLGALSGAGRSLAVIPIEHVYGNNTVTVTAVSSDGSLSGEATVSLPTTNPVLDLYEDHPLYGILFNNALSPLSTIGENEVTFAAIPYFMQAQSTADRQLAYRWSVNGNTVDVSPSDPNEITVNANNSSGQAAIALDLTHSGNFYLEPSGTWNITLSANGSGSGSGGGSTTSPFASPH